MMTDKIAVVLFNLGGPDGPDAVQPFLKNLFSDKAIIRAPGPIRWMLANLISASRAKSARENYAKMGGGSPLLPETEAQAKALEVELTKRGWVAKTFIAMRYWKPFAKDTLQKIELWAPTKVILLPLYPQFSTTTTASSLLDWRKSGGRADGVVCCYPTAAKLVSAHAAKILEAWRQGGEPSNVRVLLSAHGLPENVIKSGDPYQSQVEKTAEAVRAELPDDWEVTVCYQSKVGPLKWIGPATDEAIIEGARANKALIVSPIAFVSEHIETLVELDEEYKHVAEENGVRSYIRVPALGLNPLFIELLGDLVESALLDPLSPSPMSECGGRLCSSSFAGCPNQRACRTPSPANALGMSA
jgi:ferrochelatase